HPEGGEHRSGVEPVRGAGGHEVGHRLGVDGLGAVEGDPPPGQVERAGGEAAQGPGGQGVGEVGPGGGGGPVLRHPLHPPGGGSITPLGSAVEPLVNWRTASEDGSSLGASQAQGSLASPVRSGSSTTGGSPGSGSRNPDSMGSATSRVVSAARTWVRVWVTKS